MKTLNGNLKSLPSLLQLVLNKNKTNNGRRMYDVNDVSDEYNGLADDTALISINEYDAMDFDLDDLIAVDVFCEIYCGGATIEIMREPGGRYTARRFGGSPFAAARLVEVTQKVIDMYDC